MSKPEKNNRQNPKITNAAKRTVDGTKASPVKARKPMSGKAPPQSAFEKVAGIRATMPPLPERVVGTPFGADIQDQTTDFMNRAEITIRVEKQFVERILKMLDEFAREHPAAKLRAGTFNARLTPNIIGSNQAMPNEGKRHAMNRAMPNENRAIREAEQPVMEESILNSNSPTLAELLKTRRAYRAALWAVEREIADRLEADRDAGQETCGTNQGLIGQIADLESSNEPTEFTNGNLIEEFAGMNEMFPHGALGCAAGEYWQTFADLPPLLPAQVRDEEMDEFFKRIAEPGLAEFCRELRRSNIEARIFRTRQARRVIAGEGANTYRFEVWVDDEIRLTAARHVPQGNDPQVTGKRGRGAYVTTTFAERRYSRADINQITPTMIAATFLAHFRSLHSTPVGQRAVKRQSAIREM